MLDIAEHPMEVSPSAHYSMGGVLVEPETGATEVDGLYAVGEVTGGLHGANRLGGNSSVRDGRLWQTSRRGGCGALQGHQPAAALSCCNLACRER
jgi:succinate dehydrogenase/fumarate reductase flavoprotein subunit